MTALIGLFLAAFVAATPMLMSSEVVFLGLQAAGYDPVVLVLVASAGNVLGSCVTYGSGRAAETFRDRSWFPLKPEAMAKAQGWWQRWGRWSLLVAWAPGGDLLVALAGLMRVPLWQFLALVTVAKTGRYIAVAALAGTVLS
jgi:membrane protein YqaA with SNARE-associated domain